MMQYSSIKLRTVVPEDIDLIYKWETSTDAYERSDDFRLISRESVELFIEQSTDADIFIKQQARFMAYDGNHTVGCVDLFNYDPYNRHADVGIIVDRPFRRKGYATKMLCLIEEYAKSSVNLHQISCSVGQDNTASIRLFEKCGYIHCGTLAQWIWDGKEWIDKHIYQKIIQ